MKRTNKKGFTIVELVIVIAVIAILAAVLIPNISRLVKKANESSDIQAVRNMNTFLAAEGATGDVNSILDVYDIFADSGYNVDSYSPLYSGRHFYYDKQYNQILYVETKSGKVLFPEERKNEDIVTLRDTKNHNLFSLSMEVPTLEKPTDTNYKEDKDKITATVTTPGQLAFVIDQYNKSNDILNLKLTIDASIDMMGAQCLIKTDIPKGSTATIEIEGKEGVVLKNITSNVFGYESKGNAQGVTAKYASGAIIGDATRATVTIKNLTFENLNVKNVETGSVALLVGKCSGATIENVKIKNSSVIGQRAVGALVGQLNGKVTLDGKIELENVSVQTVGGRSGLLIGQLNGATADPDVNLTVGENAQISLTNSKLSVYENSASEQKFSTETETMPAGWDKNAWGSKSSIINQDKYIMSVKTTDKDGKKTYSVYGFKADALILVDPDPSNAKDRNWPSFSATDAPLNGHVTIK